MLGKGTKHKHSQHFLSGSIASRNKRRHNYYSNPKARTQHIPHTAREVLGLPKPKRRRKFFDTSSDMVLEALAPTLTGDEREYIKESAYHLAILVICAYLLGYHCKSGNKTLEILLERVLV